VGGVDVGNQRAHDRLAVDEQLQAMAAHQRQAGETGCEPADTLRSAGEGGWRNHVFRRNAPGPAQNLRLQGNRPLHPGPAETAFADQQIRQGADGRHENDQQQPRQRRAVRTSPRKDAQRNRQRQCQIDEREKTEHHAEEYETVAVDSICLSWFGVILAW
jgi:hypothetical protein